MKIMCRVSKQKRLSENSMVSEFFCSKQEFAQERLERYNIFRSVMIECNPSISEETIQSAFIAKFGE